MTVGTFLDRVPKSFASNFFRELVTFSGEPLVKGKECDFDAIDAVDVTDASVFIDVVSTSLFSMASLLWFGQSVANVYVILF